MNAAADMRFFVWCCFMYNRSCLSRWLAARPVRVGYWGGESLCVLISFCAHIYILLIIVVSTSFRRFIICSLVPAPRCFLLPLCAFFCACTLSTWRCIASLLPLPQLTTPRYFDALRTYELPSSSAQARFRRSPPPEAPHSLVHLPSEQRLQC